MAIKLSAKCSDCNHVQSLAVGAETKELTCVLCGRKIPGLAKEEFKEAEGAIKTQMMLGIGSLVLFLAAAGCVYMWMGDSSYWTYKNGAANPNNDAMFFGFVGLGLVSMVLGILASRSRYTVEI